MGLRLSYLEFINKHIKNLYGVSVSGLTMLELGDQVVKRKSGVSESTGKEYFSNRGFDHISVDLNGNRGALIKDLTNPTDFVEFEEKFDIVTNSGTTEHVEPFESQFECFKIIHDCTKIGGLMLHLVPDIKKRTEGHFVNHCNYYYSENFFIDLAEHCGYTIIENVIVENLRGVAIIKNKKEFWQDKNTFLKNISIKPMETNL